MTTVRENHATSKPLTGLDLRTTDPHHVGEVLTEPGIPMVAHCQAVDDLPLACVQQLAAELGAIVGKPPQIRDVGCRWIVIPPTTPRRDRRRLMAQIARILRREAPLCAAAVRRCAIPHIVADYCRRQIAVHDLRMMAPGGDA